MIFENDTPLQCQIPLYLIYLGRFGQGLLVITNLSSNCMLLTVCLTNEQKIDAISVF